MKDYRLSEIKEICKSMTGDGGCLKCPLYPNVCLTTLRDVVPNKWDIEPRDMIELPCKEPLDEELFPSVWIVMYHKKTGAFGFRLYNNEAQADAVLAELKGGKR